MSRTRLIPPTLFPTTLRKGAFALLILLAILISSQHTVQQTLAAPTGTITVTTTNDNNTVDGLCSLREAITRANLGTSSTDCPGATAGGNTIVLPSGTMTLYCQRS